MAFKKWTIPFLYLLLLMVWLPQPLKAINYTWNTGVAPNGGEWIDSNNWTPSGSPSLADNASITKTTADSQSFDLLLFFGGNGVDNLTISFSAAGNQTFNIANTSLTIRNAGQINLSKGSATTAYLTSTSIIVTNPFITFDIGADTTMDCQQRVFTEVGGGGLTKTGAGNLIFAGANDQTLPVSLAQGTLTISGSNGALGNNVGLTISGTSSFVIASGAGTKSIASLDGVSGTTVNLNNNILSLGGGSYDGIISGTGGGLTKNGSGTLTLSGINTYTGTTTISAGTITFTGSTANLGGVIANNGGVIFNQSADSTFSQVISGNGTLVKQGAGNLTLPAGNSYSGATTITAGSIILSGSSSALGTGSSVALNGGNLTVVSGAGSKSIATLSGNSGSSVLALNDNLLTVTQNGDATYQGTITGTGAQLTKLGNFNLTLSGSNTYTGTTTISAGILTLSGDITQLGGDITDNATLVLNQSTDRTFSRAISGTGAVTKQGAGVLTLSANNSYSGITTISTGTLTLTGNISLLGGNIVNNATLIINQGSDRTFSRNISGSGSVTKAGTTALTLTGTNSYNGGTTITGGSLIGNTSSLQGAISVGANTIEFNQTSDGTYSGALTGLAGATFNKTGNSKLKINSDCSGFVGQTNLLNGTLVVDSPGDLQGLLIISPGARLQGMDAQLGDVTNNGTMGPGDADLLSSYSAAANDIGTINIGGDYIQSADALLEIEINHLGLSDVIVIAGTASLDGYVHALPEDGIYAEGTEFLILTAAGGYGATSFTGIVEDHPQSFFLDYRGGDSVYLVVSSNFIISSYADFLTGNAKKTYDYLFCNSSQNTDSNLANLQAVLLDQTSLQALTYALEQLCPAQYGATALVSFQNNVKMASACFTQSKSSICSCCQNNQKAHLWTQPLGFYYNQKGVQQQLGFHNYSYGLASGMLFPINGYLFFNPAIGYTHSTTTWNNQRGKVNTNTIYLSPSLTYEDGKYFASAIVQGDIDFNTAQRNINFPGLLTTCSSRFKSYNILAGFELGAKLELVDTQKNNIGMNQSASEIADSQCRGKLNFYIQPQVELYYLNLFQEGFTEGGNNYVNLEVWRKQSSYLQPNLGVQFIQEIYLLNYCLSPIIYFGYLSNIPLGPTGYVSTFSNLVMPCPAGHFAVEGYNRAVNQLSMGAEFVVTHCKNFQFLVGYNLDFLSHMNTQMVNIKLDWNF